VKDDTIVLCPRCFHRRGDKRGIHVSWRAEREAAPVDTERERLPEED
jgi:hypothetical protein